MSIGAAFFMLSDALLAINRFVTPLPWAALGVLGTYFTAQVLIARGCVAGRLSTPAGAAGADTGPHQR